ncbi:MAG: hypothetical protein AAGE18_13880 [Pseudomonadota bacterium]
MGPAARRDLTLEAEEELTGVWRRRRSLDLAVLLPLLGGLGVLPPLVGLFTADVRLFGAPLIVVYLFGLWLLLIVAARLLAGRLSRLQDRPGAAGEPDDGAG